MTLCDHPITQIEYLDQPIIRIAYIASLHFNYTLPITILLLTQFLSIFFFIFRSELTETEHQLHYNNIDFTVGPANINGGPLEITLHDWRFDILPTGEPSAIKILLSVESEFIKMQTMFQTAFRRNGSVTLRNEMRLFYWLELT